MPPSNKQDVTSINFYQSLLAELLGTFLLVVVGCGACAKFGENQQTDIVQISLAFGFSVGTIVWVIAHVSGGHINPAVTIGFLVTRRITFLRALLYIVVQSAGALAGAWVLKVVSANGTNDKLGLATPGPGVLAVQAFVIELLITFVLVLTVFATCDSVRSGIGGSGPLAIGLSIAMCHLWAVPYTGASMNPARAFGPAVVTGYLQISTLGIHATYWLGPLLGGVLAAVIYDMLFAANASREKMMSLLTDGDYDDSNFDEQGRRDSREPNDAERLKEDLSAQQDYGTMQ